MAEPTRPVDGAAHAPAAGHDIWIFGYGSLMWRPEFAYLERAPATVVGYHRAFCVASTHHRGTEARPGLVLGLDRGRACVGVAYRVAAEQAAATLAYLHARELIYGVYRQAHVGARLGDGTHREVVAIAYIVERAHPSWMGRLSPARQIELIRGARGISGTNLDYLINTVRHLRELAIAEPELVRLAHRAAGYAFHARAAGLVRPAATALRATWARRPVACQRLTLPQRRRFVHRLHLPV
jgi:glutathione-specific gamma-glutamylcyclotransferase